MGIINITIKGIVELFKINNIYYNTYKGKETYLIILYKIEEDIHKVIISLNIPKDKMPINTDFPTNNQVIGRLLQLAYMALIDTNYEFEKDITSIGADNLYSIKK